MLVLVDLLHLRMIYGFMRQKLIPSISGKNPPGKFEVAYTRETKELESEEMMLNKVSKHVKEGVWCRYHCYHQWI